MTKGLHRYHGSHDLHFITCLCYHRLPHLGTPDRRNLFPSILEETRQKYRFVVHGYVVMPEHFHLLMTEPELGDPSVVMKVIKERFSRRVNQSRVVNQSRAVNQSSAGAPLIAYFAMSGCSHSNPTPLWQKRSYDFNVRTEQKHVEKLRYMHRNSVKRGLVEKPELWEWSSFRSYLYGETGLVRVKFQEWPIEITSRPVATFGEASGAEPPVHPQQPTHSFAFFAATVVMPQAWSQSTRRCRSSVKVTHRLPISLRRNCHINLPGSDVGKAPAFPGSFFFFCGMLRSPR